MSELPVPTVASGVSAARIHIASPYTQRERQAIVQYAQGDALKRDEALAGYIRVRGAYPTQNDPYTRFMQYFDPTHTLGRNLKQRYHDRADVIAFHLKEAGFR